LKINKNNTWQIRIYAYILYRNKQKEIFLNKDTQVPMSDSNGLKKNEVLLKEYEINQSSKLDGSLMISLPSVWVKAQKLKEKDKLLYIQIAGCDDIIIRPIKSSIPNPQNIEES